MDLKEKCGLFAAYNGRTTSKDIYLGLYAQQHRGQESAGIVVSRGLGDYALHKDIGLVTNVFSEKLLHQLDGTFGIGHVRYSTSGSCAEKDIQPLVATHRGQIIAMAHNGNIVNALDLKEGLESDGSVFTTTSDSEVILHKIVRVRSDDPVEKICEGLRGVEGAYSLVFLFNDGVAAVRDPFGFRPLFLGRKDGSIFFASETCAFDILNAECVAEVSPGEGYFVGPKGLRRFQLPVPAVERMCSFETIYFSRPDSQFKNQAIHRYRIKLGEELAREHPVDADIVTGIPDSSNSASLGYSIASGIPLDIVLVRSHYTGRTFIAPYQSMRDLNVRKKINIISDSVLGKRVVVVDDSIVRGTTSRQIVKMFRDHGAAQVHLRIASPMVRHPCFFGIDMPDPDDFLANKAPADQLAGYLGVDSIGYLSVDALKRVVGDQTCMACFTGKYPVPVNGQSNCISKTAAAPESAPLEPEPV